MTLQERITDAHQRSVKLYLQRQDIELQRQQLQMSAQSVERDLLSIDGEIQALMAAAADMSDLPKV